MPDARSQVPLDKRSCESRGAKTGSPDHGRRVRKVDFFFNGLGTAGSSLGISKRLQQDNPELQTVAIVPETNHFFPGIRSLSQMWESGLFERHQYKTFLNVAEQEAIDGMLMLNRQCGVLCGVTAGANFSGSLKYLKDVDETLTARGKAVFIVCDRMEWYISYLRERRPEIFAEPENENSLSRFVDNEDIGVDVEMSPQTLDNILISKERTLVVDIRTSQSFNLLCISASMNMPLELFRKAIDGTNPFEESLKVILVCAVGEQSRYYARYLRKLGCNAYSLSGGIMSWRDLQDGKCLAA